MNRAVTSILWLLLAGCAGQLMEERGGSCITDEDCVEPQVCIENICSVDPESEAEIVMEMAAPEGPAQWARVGRLADTHEFTHTLGRVVEVSGRVLLAGDSDVLVPASIELLPQDWFLPRGRPPVVFRTDAQEEEIAPGKTYSIRLPPGRYRVRVRPNDVSVLPPFEDELVLEGEPVRRDFHVPLRDEVRGRITWADGAGVEGAQVRAWADGGTRLASTSGTTGPCPDEGAGCFALYVAAEDTALTIRVSGTDGGPLIPTVDFERTGRELETIVLDAYGPPITLQGTVEGRLSSGALVSVPYATVELRSRFLGTGGERLDGSVGTVVQADVEGSFEAVLLAGTYQVTVVPPGNGDAATLAVLTQDQLVNDPDGDLFQRGIAFQLEPRSKYAGALHVSGLEGVDAAGVTVEALGGLQRWSSPDEHPNEVASRSVFAATAGDGTFLLEVDRGHYDVTFKPPPGTSAAWTVIREIDLTRDMDGQAPILTVGSVLLGTIFDPRSEPAAGTTLRFYANVEDGSVQVAETTTDELGGYRVFLPDL